MNDTIEIKLSKTGKHAGKYVAIVDSVDDVLDNLNWIVRTDNRHHTQYATTNVYLEDGRRTLASLHRVVMERKLERKLQTHEHVDHIDMNGLNNRRDNLRLVTPMQNAGNQRRSKSSSTGFKGVTKQRGRYRARIRFNGKPIHIGYYATEQEAHKAYCAKSLELYGEYANDGTGQIVTD